MKLTKIAVAAAIVSLPGAIFAAAPDVTAVVTTASTLWETIGVIAISILTFTVGARLVRRFVK